MNILDLGVLQLCFDIWETGFVLAYLVGFVVGGTSLKILYDEIKQENLIAIR